MEEVTCQMDGRKAWEQGCVWLVDELVVIISKSPSPTTNTHFHTQKKGLDMSQPDFKPLIGFLSVVSQLASA